MEGRHTDREGEKDIVRSQSRDNSHSRSRDFPNRERAKENSRIRVRNLRPCVSKRDEIETKLRAEKRRQKKEEPPAEPEADLERDQQTVFSFQIFLKANERDVYEFLSRAGKVCI